MTTSIQVGYLPIVPAIELSPGAPGPLCLYADCQPRQSETLVYLCNSGSEALTEVTVATTSIDKQQFFSQPRDERWEGGTSITGEEHWDVVTMNAGVLVASVDHYIMDFVRRYRVAFTDAEGRRCWLLLNTHPSNEAQQTWVTLQTEPA